MSALAILEHEESLMEGTRIFQMDTAEVATLPEGDYQLGLVLTTDDGDPFELHTWYNGMLGLLDVRGLRVAASSETENDEDDNANDENGGTDENGSTGENGTTAENGNTDNNGD